MPINEVMPRPGRPGRAPDDPALAASLSPDGVFRVAPPSPPSPPPRLRRRVAVLAAALAMCAIPAVGIAGLDREETIGPGPVPDLSAIVEARYQQALELGTEGRYMEARRLMLTVVPYRSSEAAVRSWSTRAAQRLVARARSVEANRPALAAAFRAEAAALAPALDALRVSR
jgi:hypothetical protein